MDPAGSGGARPAWRQASLAAPWLSQLRRWASSYYGYSGYYPAYVYGPGVAYGPNYGYDYAPGYSYAPGYGYAANYGYRYGGYSPGFGYGGVYASAGRNVRVPARRARHANYR